VVHDVALQKLPVRFAMDRAGLVGADGPTHAGAYDITYIASLPNFVVMAPSDEAELCHMIATANSIDWGPSAFRYPRGASTGLDLAAAGVVDWKGKPLEIGKGRIVKQGADVAILGYGTGVQYALVRATLLYLVCETRQFLQEALGSAGTQGALLGCQAFPGASPAVALRQPLCGEGVKTG